VTFRILEVEFDDPRAVALREVLDVDLDARYAEKTAGEPEEVTAERSRVLAVHAGDVVATFLAVDANGAPVGHVLLRRLGEDWELKRLVVASAARRRGIGRALTSAVVDRARSEGAHRIILQTGGPQPESRALYEAEGFTSIEVYEPYRETMPGSLCYELRLAP
jgi:GNAT superfamily N-acetyltransferase